MNIGRLFVLKECERLIHRINFKTCETKYLVAFKKAGLKVRL